MDVAEGPMAEHCAHAGFRRHAVALNGEGVVRGVLIDVVDKFQIGAPIGRQARWGNGCVGNDGAVRLPDRLEASGNGRDAGGDRWHTLLLRKRITLPHIIADSFHDLDDIVGNGVAPDAAEGAGKASGDGRMAPSSRRPRIAEVPLIVESATCASTGARLDVLMSAASGV